MSAFLRKSVTGWRNGLKVSEDDEPSNYHRATVANGVRGLPRLSAPSANQNDEAHPTGGWRSGGHHSLSKPSGFAIDA